MEKKWQGEWEKAKAFELKDDSKKPKSYVLEMFPYPSGSGLHMGHAFNYTIGDIFARYKRMNGFNVLYPMGYDAFGLPAENAAIKANVHPGDYTDKSIANFIKQQKGLGLSYDWSKMVVTCTPEYYKWNQFFFLEFLKNGLVYRKKAAVNWCPKCETVLANEQVQGGKCWRHTDTEVELKQLEQWFVKTTKYSEELLEFIPKLDWPQRIKVMQENWIGKSYGTEIIFEINGEKWPIFTTRPDTIFGVTFVVVSAQHPKLNELVTKEQRKEVDIFLKKIKSTSEKDAIELEKEGAFTGSYAINPMTKERVPVYTGNFVVADYGSGMVMAVPAHDERDYTFAKKYGIKIKVVIQPKGKKIDVATMKSSFTEDGELVDSEKFSGMDNKKAIEEITKHLEKSKLGKKTINYKFRDWLISRQRYWGTPIPIIYCTECGAVPVPKKDLPVLLPKKVIFGQGNPLLSSKEFVEAKCPKCGKKGRRETDTMDTFFDSSWYFLRYCDNKNSKAPFDKKKIKYWLPVDQYIGGAEHACMHLIYARFFTKALRDLNYLELDEPFAKLFNQGMLHGSDGFVMSKSRGNVVLPEEVSKTYGIDTARLFLVSQALPDKDMEWKQDGIEGSLKIVNKVISFVENAKIGESSKRIESKVNKAIRDISKDIEEFRYNFAIIKLRALFDSMEKEEKVSKEHLEAFIKLLHPFCPHITEEMWSKLGNKSLLSLANWPMFDEKLIDEQLEKIESVVSQLRLDILRVKELAKLEKVSKVKIFVAPQWKWRALEIVKKAVANKPDFGAAMKALMSDAQIKKFGAEVPAFLKTAMNRLGEISNIEKFDEVAVLNEAKPMLQKEFGSIEIIKAEDSKEVKAKNAFPGKPALLIE